jgi:hypothetical protein
MVALFVLGVAPIIIGARAVFIRHSFSGGVPVIRLQESYGHRHWVWPALKVAIGRYPLPSTNAK